MRKILAFVAALAGCGSAVADSVRVTSTTWTERDESFGGFSGLEVSEDGMRFYAITDRGTLWSGAFERRRGDPVAVLNAGAVRMRGPNGEPLPEARDDSEGLAIDAAGRMFVSFEGPARVLAYPAPGTVPQALPRPDAFRQMQKNSSLEALAIDPEGRLLTLPERSGRDTRPFPVFRFDGQRWSVAFELPRRPPFLAVGLDVDARGRLYLLERDFTGIGFRSRLRRFDAAGRNEETIWQSGNAAHDNLEGISVWQDPQGRTRVTMISDDNFRFLQRTEFVELTLTD